MKKYNNQQSGLTLVELIIVMGMMAVLMITMTDVFASLAAARLESSATSAVSEDGRFIMARLNYDIRRATSVTTPASLGASSTSLVMQVGGTAFTYALSGGNLQLTNTLGTTNLNGSGTTVTSFTVQRIGNSGGKETLRMVVTVQGVATPKSGPKQLTFTTTVGRR